MSIENNTSDANVTSQLRHIICNVARDDISVATYTVIWKLTLETKFE